MKREELYESPQMEIVEVEAEQVLLAASGESAPIDDMPYGGGWS